MGFRITEANAMRGLTHESIDEDVDRRNQWREMARKRNNLSVREPITQQCREHLHSIFDIINAFEYKLVTSMHNAWVYTNDINLAHAISKIRYVSSKTYTEAIIARPANTIALQTSKYQSRSYFVSVKLTANEKDNLGRFFDNQATHIRTSPALTAWLKTDYKRTQDYFFIDYTDDSWLTMLALVRPGLIRKTLSIIPAK